MPKQNLRVHISDRRASENTKQNFKFNNRDNLYKLSKWLGEESNPTKENVSYGTKVNYEISYSDDIYHLIDWNLFKNSIGNDLFAYYKNYYRSGWFLDNQPQINSNSDFIFEKDPVFAEKVIIDDTNNNIFIIGDLHSSMHSLVDIMNELRDRNFFVNDTFQIKSNCYIFFLGDMIDRGPYGIEILCFVFMLKLENRNNVYIINGNHEDADIYYRYGFLDEMDEQFDFSNIKEIKNLLYSFPSVIYLKFGTKWYHLCHGAIPDPSLDKENDIQLFLNDESKFMLIENYNPYNTLKWGDLKVTDGYFNPGNGRPQFGTDQIKNYCDYLGISSLITGHQDMETLLIQPNPESQYFKQHVNDQNQLGNDMKIGDDIIYIGPDNKRFKYCARGGCNYQYDLYSVFDKTTFNLDPTQDFYGLVTSTATVSKGLYWNCYLELTEENTIIDIIKNCNL